MRTLRRIDAFCYKIVLLHLSKFLFQCALLLPRKFKLRARDRFRGALAVFIPLALDALRFVIGCFRKEALLRLRRRHLSLRPNLL